MKYFRMSYEEVVFKRSYLNLILLNRAIPGIKPFDERNDSKIDIDMGDENYGVTSQAKSSHASNFFLNFM